MRKQPRSAWPLRDRLPIFFRRRGSLFRGAHFRRRDHGRPVGQQFDLDALDGKAGRQARVDDGKRRRGYQGNVDRNRYGYARLRPEPASDRGDLRPRRDSASGFHAELQLQKSTLLAYIRAISHAG